MTDDERKEILDIFLTADSSRDKKSGIIPAKLPKKLYKFRSGNDWDIEALENDSIWMGNATMMDDPYDSKILFTDEFRAKMSSVINNVERFKADKYRVLLKDDSIQGECFLCSLTEVGDSEDMWTRYANCDQGFCIEYNTIDLMESVKLPVLPIYYRERPLEDEETISELDKPALIFKNFLIKDKTGPNGEDWYSQREWRIIAFRKRLGLDDNNDKGKCIAICKPSKVILGKNIAEQARAKILDWKNRVGNENIEIIQR